MSTAVVLADVQGEGGMALEEGRQVRKDEGARHRAVHVDAEQPADLAARQRRFGVLDLRQDRLAAPVVALALGRRRDVPGGPLQEADAEPLLELLDRRGRA